VLVGTHKQVLPALLATDLDYYFEQLMLVYQHQLYAFALRQVGNVQDAEDIVQEAFLRAYHALKLHVHLSTRRR
jgi:RNA polymerase sigma-70 factor (ECF subfamily)